MGIFGDIRKERCLIEKINFINNQQPALNSTNLNKLQDNIEDSMKSEQTTSDTDTYSCNYINEIITSGNNYTKFKDGTLIVYGTTPSISWIANFDTKIEINMPIEFKDTNYSVQITLHEQFAHFTNIYLCAFTRTTTSVEIGGYNSHSDVLNGQLDYLIIGKWK